METDDIIYLSLLVFSIIFGYFYRQIENVEKKKIIGSLVGFLIAVTVSGFHMLHFIFTIFINSLIILCIPKRHCHLVSFFFSFGYLVFFRTTIYFGLPYPPGHTNLIQMMLTLKLVGLAFELNSYWLQKQKTDGEKKTEEWNSFLEPSFVDIWHYSFNYVGVLTGPYFRYCTFYDSIYTQFPKHANCGNATINKLKWVPLFAVIFLVVTKIWPISYAYNEEFYLERSWLYRWWYVTPTFCWFRMRIYIGLTLSECVCTMAGLGAYPTFAASKPGEGPTKELDKLREISKNDFELKKLNYDFTTIYNINPYGSDFCMTFREAMKHWNICIQYWLAMNVYRRFPFKKIRVFATTFVSAAWHGVYLGYYYCILCVPFYLAVEDVYMNITKNMNTYPRLKYFIIWFLKMQGFAYFGFAFHLLTVEKVMKFYNSVYHCGEIIMFVSYLLGLFIKSKMPKESKITNERKVI